VKQAKCLIVTFVEITGEPLHEPGLAPETLITAFQPQSVIPAPHGRKRAPEPPAGIHADRANLVLKPLGINLSNSSTEIAFITNRLFVGCSIDTAI
jgi:hypothetical protein